MKNGRWFAKSEGNPALSVLSIPNSFWIRNLFCFQTNLQSSMKWKEWRQSATTNERLRRCRQSIMPCSVSQTDDRGSCRASKPWTGHAPRSRPVVAWGLLIRNTPRPTVHRRTRRQAVRLVCARLLSLCSVSFTLNVTSACVHVSVTFLSRLLSFFLSSSTFPSSLTDIFKRMIMNTIERT